MEQILEFKMLAIIQLKTTTRNLNKIRDNFTHIAFHQADCRFGPITRSNLVVRSLSDLNHRGRTSKILTAIQIFG
jgi:hypothetical protein